jgi:hypothetical protein
MADKYTTIVDRLQIFRFPRLWLFTIKPGRPERNITIHGVFPGLVQIKYYFWGEILKTVKR